MKITPLKAIRAKCLDCCCWQAREVKLCTAEKCPLFLYRFGHKPKEGNLSYDDSLSQNTPKKPQIFGKESYSTGGDEL